MSRPLHLATVPAVLVTGTCPASTAEVTVGLQWALQGAFEGAVVVEHRIDPEAQLLHRTVSDVDGVVERESVELDHACVTCAVRADVVPTLQRLAASGRWQVVLAHLPVGAEAAQVCRVLATAPGSPVRVGAVVAAVPGPRAVEDLLGDALLRERGLASAPDDARGVGEVLCAQVEQADAVVLVGGGVGGAGTAGSADAVERELVATLARPGVAVVTTAADLDPRGLVALHDHAATERWAGEVPWGPLVPRAGEHAWSVELHADRPFHPERLRAHVAAFADSLLTADELRRRGRFWEVDADGLEGWLGPVRRVA